MRGATPILKSFLFSSCLPLSLPTYIFLTSTCLCADVCYASAKTCLLQRRRFLHDACTLPRSNSPPFLIPPTPLLIPSLLPSFPRGIKKPSLALPSSIVRNNFLPSSPPLAAEMWVEVRVKVGGRKEEGNNVWREKTTAAVGERRSTASGVRETPNRGHDDADQRALKKNENKAKVAVQHMRAPISFISKSQGKLQSSTLCL